MAEVNQNIPVIDQYTPPINTEALKLPEHNNVQDMSFVIDGIRNTTPKTTTNLDFIDSNLQKSNNLNSLFTPNKKKSFYNEGFKLDDAYTRLNSGDYVAKFDNFLQGTDNEQRFALNQSKPDKWISGLGKFLGKTSTAILGGTIGTLYGAAEAIFTADLDAVWDNDFQEMMDDWNVKMDYKLPNYYTQEEKEKGFFGSLGTANFWANDFLGGLSFTVGAIVTEAIWAGATGGTSLVTAASRYGLRGANTLRAAKNLKTGTKFIKDYLSKVNGIKRAKRLGQVTQGLNTLRYVYTSAGYEAGVEARHYKNEQESKFYNNFEEINGRPPTSYEIASFEENLNKTANSVFATNLALVGSSNLIVFGKMFNIKNPLSLPKSKLTKTIFGSGLEVAEDGTKQAIKRNLSQRVAGTTYSILKVPVIEGIYEEGLQSVTSTSASSLLESSYDLNSETIDLMGSIYEGFSHTYGTKEGWKEVGLGMLIGMFGGGMSAVGTGQNPFSNVIDAASKESKVYQQKADILNHYSSKKLVNEMFRLNNLSKASSLERKAEQKGDLFGQESARTMGILSNIIYGERMGYGDMVYQDLVTEVENFPNEQLAQNMEITVEEAKELKAKTVSEYKEIKDEYTKNRDFSQYVIGSGKIDQDNEINVEVAKDMIAYQMTMASKAESISKDYVKAIMSEVGDFNNQGNKLKNVIEIEDSLRRATKENKKHFTDLQKTHKRTETQLANLERKRLTQERRLNSTKEDNQNIASQLTQTTQDIANIQNELNKLEQQLEQSYSALTLYTISADSEGFILGSELAQLNKNIVEFEEYLKNVSQKDKTKSARIEKYLQEYRKSLDASVLFGEVIEDLINPETGLKGQTRTFLNKLKEHKDPTARLVENLKKAQQNFAEGQATTFSEKIEVNEETEEGADIIKDASAVTEVNGETVATPRTKNINDHIDELLKSNEYVLSNFGKDIEGKKPKKEDILRYEELLNKFNIDPDSIINQSLNTISKRGIIKVGLSIEEIQEYKDLNQKLSDWRVIDGVTNSNNVSIADLVDQKQALNTKVKQNDIAPMNSNEEIEVAVGIKGGAYSNEMSSEMINTPDTVMIQRRGSKYHLTHIKIKNFVEKGATLKKNGNIITNYNSLHKGVHTLDFENDSVSFKFVGHSRMEFTDEELIKLLRNTNLAVIDTTSIKGSSWSPVYEKDEQGNYKPMETDYSITIKGSDYNILDPQKLYDLNMGEEVFFKISLKDSFNLSFEEPYINAVIAYEENPSKENKNKLLDIQNEIFKQTSIYIVNGNNDVVGQLKGALDDIKQTEDFKAIRKYAGNILIDNYDPNNARLDSNGISRSEFTLPFTTKVTSLFIGTPNLNITVNEDGTAIPNKVDFNERTIEMVESFGVIEDGVITLNEGNKINLKDVNKQFVQNMEKTNPIVVIKYKNQKIAYPISLKEDSSTIIEEVASIVNSKEDISNKVVNLAKFLANNGIDPKKYDIKYIDSDNNFFNSPNFNKLINDLGEVKQPIVKEDFLSKDFKVENLLTVGQITINLENNPFQAPKIQVDLKTPIRYNKETEIEEESYFDKTGKASKTRIDIVVSELISKKPSEISSFNKKVLSLYKSEIEKKLGKKLKLSPIKKVESIRERNKKC